MQREIQIYISENLDDASLGSLCSEDSEGPGIEPGLCSTVVSAGSGLGRQTGQQVCNHTHLLAVPSPAYLSH